MQKLTFATVVAFFSTGMALAHHDKTPLREAVMDGHSHAVGGATIWLAGAMIALVLALVAVQKTVFRKR